MITFNTETPDPYEVLQLDANGYLPALDGRNLFNVPAAKLGTAVNLMFNGAVSGSGSFDGSQNLTIGLALSATGVTAGVVGNATSVPILTIGSDGRISATSTATITPNFSSIQNTPTTLAGYGITDAIVTGALTVTGISTLNSLLKANAGVNTTSVTATGNVGAATLTVSGITTHTGAVAANGGLTTTTLAASGITTLNGVTTINPSPDTIPTAVASTLPSSLYVTGPSSNTGSTVVYAGGGAPIFVGVSVGGTTASPTGVASAKNLLNLQAYAYDGTAYGYGGQISIAAAQAWGSGAHGSRIKFNVIPNNTTTAVTAATIDQNGSLLINTTTNNGTDMLQVAGSGSFTTALAVGTTLAVTGVTTLTGQLNANGAISTTALTASGLTTLSGNATVAGTLVSTGAFTASSGITTTTYSGTGQMLLNTNTTAINAGVVSSITPLLAMQATDGVATTLQMSSFGVTNRINAVYSSGTAAAPVAITGSANMLKIQAFGYDGTGYYPGGAINLQTTQAWTSTAHGSSLTFGVNANNTTSSSIQMMLDQDGSLLLGSTTNASTGRLQVTGNGSITGTLAVATPPTSYFDSSTGVVNTNWLTAASPYFSALIGQATDVSAALTAAGTSVTFTASEVIMGTAYGSRAVKRGSLSLAFSGSSTGAGGMDTGSLPTSGYVAFYAIYNRTTNTTSIIGQTTTSTLAPRFYSGSNLPSGYTDSALLMVWPTNSSANLIIGHCQDRRFYLTASTAVSTTTSTGASYVSLSISSIVPVNAKKVFGIFYGTSTVASAQVALHVASDNTAIWAGGMSTGITATANGTAVTANWEIPIYTAQTIYYATSTSSGTGTFTFFVTGYEI